MKRVGVIIVVVVVTALAVAGSSLAGNAVVTGHNAAPPVTSNLGTTGSPSGKPTTGTLPFTGLDLAGIAAIAAVLLGGGLILARASRKAR